MNDLRILMFVAAAATMAACSGTPTPGTSGVDAGKPNEGDVGLVSIACYSGGPAGFFSCTEVNAGPQGSLHQGNIDFLTTSCASFHVNGTLTKPAACPMTGVVSKCVYPSDKYTNETTVIRVYGPYTAAQLAGQEKRCVDAKGVWSTTF